MEIGMEITVHLHTILQKRTPQGVVSRLDLKLSERTSMGDLLKLLEIEMEPDALLLAVNGRVADLDQELQDEDVVNLMPAISGGAVSVGDAMVSGRERPI
jgi:sulfur carrier protein ThiS